MQLNQSFLEKNLPSLQSIAAPFKDNAHFCIDSRSIHTGDVFVALEGNKVNGHSFLTEAIARGASGILIEEKYKDYLDQIDSDTKNKLFIGIVTNTHDALLQLAKAWRDILTCSFVGITGSVGKTSTKELLAAFVEQSGIPFIASIGNNNTALSLSQTILRIREHHKIAILEMGISKRGEMARMVEIVRPTIGIITAIGHSHMEGLGSLHGIAAEKRTLFSLFTPDNIGIIDGDTPLLSSIAYPHPVIKFGMKMTNQVQARRIQNNGVTTSFILKLYQEKYAISLQSNHTGRISNALAAAAAAYHLGIKGDTIARALEQAQSVPGRFRLIELKKFPAKIIDDAYNANPESMKAALTAFEKIKTTGHKIAVLGDMLELGIKSSFWHCQVGRFLAKTPSLTHLILVGKQAEFIKKTAPLHLRTDHVSSWKEALPLLENVIASQESVVLIKGSRGTLLYQLVQALTHETV